VDSHFLAMVSQWLKKVREKDDKTLVAREFATDAGKDGGCRYGDGGRGEKN